MTKKIGQLGEKVSISKRKPFNGPRSSQRPPADEGVKNFDLQNFNFNAFVINKILYYFVVGSRSFLDPNIIPPVTSHQISEPLMNIFVRNGRSL